MTEYREQPMPTPSDRESIQAMVRADLAQREQVGIARYGTPLQANNGRDALRDAYEEALDLACYLRQAIEERGEPAPVGPCAPAPSLACVRDRDGDIWYERAAGGYSTGRHPLTVLRRARVELLYGPLTEMG